MGVLHISRPPLLRSLLFIPGTTTELLPKAIAAGADGVVFDLEDAVTFEKKPEARAQVSAVLSRSDLPNVPIFVRINALSTLESYRDLVKIVRPGLSGVMIPKVESADDITIVDRMLTWLEQENQVSVGSTMILPLLETAIGMHNAHSVALGSPRVAYLGGLGVKGGDIERALGYRWTPRGDESYMMRSSVLLQARAAGVANPLTGLWTAINDVDGLEEFARHSRDLGYEGMLAIHPDHVPTINAAFTPSSESIEQDRRLIKFFDAKRREGDGAVILDGEMIDEAMYVSAIRRLEKFGHAPEGSVPEGGRSFPETV